VVKVADLTGLRRWLTKPWVVMPLVALLLVGGWLGWRSRNDDGTAAAQSTGQVVTASTGTMARTISAEGTVAAAESEDLSFSAAGEVTAVNVVAGQAVTAGDVLATIDSAALEADVADAEASVAEAEAKLSDDTDAGASSAQLSADRSALTSARDRLAEAEDALADAELIAPFDGVVSTVDITVGEQLSSGGSGGTSLTGSASGSGDSSSSLGSGSSSVLPQTGGTDTDTSSSGQITVVSASLFTVELGLDSTEIEDVQVGQTATVSLSSTTSGGLGGFPAGGFPTGGFPTGGFPGAGGGGQTTDEPSDEQSTQAPATSDTPSVTGTVTSVGSVADASSGVAKYPVTVTFQDTSGNYNAGATVSAEITYAEVTDAVQVPSFAVTTTNGSSTVKVIEGDQTETRTVTTGLTSGTMVQITSGLQAGEQVAIELAVPGQGGRTGAPPSGAPTGLFGGGADTGAGSTDD
jgi:macrolide-specific efflux system membrane fusion protein